MIILVLLFVTITFFRFFFLDKEVERVHACFLSRKRLQRSIDHGATHASQWYSECPSLGIAFRLAMKGIRPSSQEIKGNSTLSFVVSISLLFFASCGSSDNSSHSSPEFLYPYESWGDIDGDYIASSSCGHSSVIDQSTTWLTERYEDGILKYTDPLSEEELRSFSKLAHNTIIRLFPKVSGSNSRRVEAIFDKLIRYVPKEYKRSLEVYLVSSGQVTNAFTVAGGKIYITTAMLRSIKNEDELALVLGHEISHQIKGHTTLKLRQQKYLVDNLGEVGGKLTDAIINLLTFPFNAPEEYEADCGGMWLCAQAGFNVERGILIFNTWAKQEGSAPRNSFVSTHPKASKRFACCSTLTIEAKERAINN